MDIRNIRTFIKVSEYGNFTKASLELGYAQSTVSAQIQQLEKELGTNLFDRNGKIISLSKAGKEFLPYAYELMKYESMALDHFSYTGEPAGQLRIGIMETLAASHYATLFQSFVHQYPEVSLTLQLATTHQAVNLLKHGQFDLIFLLDAPTTYPGLILAAEYPVDICFFCSSESPLASKKKLCLEDLLSEPFVLTEKNCNYRAVFDNDIAEKGKTLRCITEIGYTPYIIDAVSQQQGIGFLPAPAIQDALTNGIIRQLFVCDYQLQMTIQVLYNDRAGSSNLLNSFLDFIQSHTINMY